MTYTILETCVLVPGFSRTECASWVQAIGTLLAIGVAIWLGHRQHRLGVKQRATERIEGLLSAWRLLAYVDEQVVRGIKAMEGIADAGHTATNWDDRFLFDTESCYQALCAFPIERVDEGGLLLAFIGARSATGSYADLTRSLRGIVTAAPSDDRHREFWGTRRARACELREPVTLAREGFDTYIHHVRTGSTPPPEDFTDGIPWYLVAKNRRRVPALPAWPKENL